MCRQNGLLRWRLIAVGVTMEKMLQYHVVYHLPRGADKMVVAEVLDFPGAISQGFDLADARVIIASALEDLAQLHLEEGRPLPMPNPGALSDDADLVELIPISIEAGSPRR